MLLIALLAMTGKDVHMISTTMATDKQVLQP
jgi:hypothetical protein